MPRITDLLADPATSIAVVGANDDPAKYGSRIYRDLKAKGYTVYPVNPNRDTVDGDPAYPTIADLPEQPAIVNFVVPPRRTLRILHTASQLGLTTVWVQPGAASPDVVEYLEREGFDFIVDACIMVMSRAYSHA